MEKHKQIGGVKRADVRCLSHNLYSGYLAGIHKILAPQQDPDTPVLIVSAVGLLVVIALAILT